MGKFPDMDLESVFKGVIGYWKYIKGPEDE